MILHVNHVRPGHAKLAGDVVATLLSLLEDGRIQSSILQNLDVHLDWIQYKTNFREPIILRKAVRNDELLPMIEIAVDLRQIGEKDLRESLAAILQTLLTVIESPWSPSGRCETASCGASTSCTGNTCPTGRESPERDTRRRSPEELPTATIPSPSRIPRPSSGRS